MMLPFRERVGGPFRCYVGCMDQGVVAHHASLPIATMPADRLALTLHNGAYDRSRSPRPPPPVRRLWRARGMDRPPAVAARAGRVDGPAGARGLALPPRASGGGRPYQRGSRGKRRRALIYLRERP